ncbi:Synapsin, ATP binding domain protein, partial [Teladorsagia circumcincta]
MPSNSSSIQFGRPKRLDYFRVRDWKKMPGASQRWIANWIANSAPASPARSSESLAAALERSLQYDRSRGPPAMPPDAKVLLVIDNQGVDWSKYFRNPNDFPIRVEQVEVEPYVDLKFDVHVQKIGHEIKTFLRRGISKNWKSNVGSAVLEQLPTNERHKQYIHAICEHVGRMSICSIDILVSKEGREYVHDVNDVIAYFGESQEDDRRNTAALLRAILAPPPRLPSRPSMERPKEAPKAPVHNATRAHSIEKKPAEIPEKRELREQASVTSQSSFADDTMGQLKRTFAGIFGE